MMIVKPGATAMLFGAWMLMAEIAYGGACIVSGSNRIEAARQVPLQCDGQARDCDPHRGQWFCSNEELSKNQIENWLVSGTTDTGNSAIPNVEPDSLLASVPENACVDPDGDGWGWNGVASCQILPDTQSSSNSNTLVTSQNDCIDPDGDAWGWNGTASCRVDTATVNNVAAVALNSVVKNTSSDNSACAGNYHPSDITDLVLATGQSNLTGAETSVSASFDRYGRVIEFHDPDKPHPRVFAWTVDPGNNNNGTGWKVADLTQSWHDSSPGAGGVARNNFAFHFAKKVAEGPGCRVVGFVVVSEGGRGISHWDDNAPGWNEVSRHLNDAMSAIGRTSIDGILWHQGESDWIIDGTCYTGASCRNGLPDYYPQMLYSRLANPAISNSIGQNSLIDRLRRQSWYSSGKPFIAGETVKAPVNNHLNKLNTDNDRWTATVRGDVNSGIGIRADDPHKNHYNADGLRELGARYAAAYLDMKQ